MENSNSRLTELETRVAFQEDAIAAINEELATHIQRIYELETQLRHLHQKLADLSSAAETQVQPQEAESPPPHY